VFRIWILPAVALSCAVPWALFALSRRVSVRRAAVEAVFVGYMAAMLYIVLMPLPWRAYDSRLVSAWVNLAPTRTVIGIIRQSPGLVIQQLVGNVLIFIPLGFLLPLLYAPCRRFATTASIGLAVSAGIELVQLALLLTGTARRSVDVDDVLLNVTGVCLGYVVWRGAEALDGRCPRRSGAVEDGV
jgi:glycopeptide antibiotics resistance protein